MSSKPLEPGQARLLDGQVVEVLGEMYGSDPPDGIVEITVRMSADTAKRLHKLKSRYGDKCAGDVVNRAICQYLWAND